MSNLERMNPEEVEEIKKYFLESTIRGAQEPYPIYSRRGKKEVMDVIQNLQDRIAFTITPDNLEMNSIDKFSVKFRNNVGGILPDETNLKDLIIDFRSDTERYKKIPINIKRGYSRTIFSAARKFETLGELRSASPEQIRKLKNVGEKSANFLEEGFEPFY